MEFQYNQDNQYIGNYIGKKEFNETQWIKKKIVKTCKNTYVCLLKTLEYKSTIYSNKLYQIVLFCLICYPLIICWPKSRPVSRFRIWIQYGTSPAVLRCFTISMLNRWLLFMLLFIVHNSKNWKIRNKILKFSNFEISQFFATPLHSTVNKSVL